MTLGWWKGFKQRDPKVTLCVAEHLSHSQRLACKSDALTGYFDLLEQIIEDNASNMFTTNF